MMGFVLLTSKVEGMASCGGLCSMGKPCFWFAVFSFCCLFSRRIHVFCFLFFQFGFCGDWLNWNLLLIRALGYFCFCRGCVVCVCVAVVQMYTRWMD